MPRFAFVYHGGSAPSDPAEQERVMGAWNSFYQNLGSAVLDGGGPAGMSKTVSNGGIADDGGANPVSGMTIVEAPDQDAACEMAKGCPMVADGSGSVEVVEILQM